MKKRNHDSNAESTSTADDTLPPGWATAQVSELVDLVNGYAFKPTDWKDSGLPIIRIQNLNDPDAPFNRCPDKLPAKYLVKPGDLLFAWSGTPGTSFGAHIWRGQDAWLNQHIFKVLFDPEHLESRFLRLAINHNLESYIQQAHGGAGLAHITKKKFDASILLIAPFNEQRRIVEKIDELFSDLDAGVAALNKAKANLKRYREGVLKAAVDGSLTAEWRETTAVTETGSQLLEKILAERRRRWEVDQLAKFEAAEKTPPKNWQEKYVEPELLDTSDLPELPEGWCWSTLESIADLTGGITKDQKRAREGTQEVPYLRVANVQRGYLDLKEIKTIHAPHEVLADLALIRGDILFTEGGDRDKLGRGWVWQEELPECIHQNHIFRARLIDSVVEPKFISHHGNTFGRDWFTTAGKQTTNLASINLGILRRFPVPLPPAEEQRQIIAEVDHQLSIVDAALTQVEQDLTRANQLRQSILRRAFEGKLVRQDPSDEPASVLLERIRQERAAKAEAEKGQKTGGKRKGAKNMTSEDRRLLLDVLKEHPKGLTPEALLREAGYAISEVDEFYSELRSIAAQIEEERPNGAKINKWPKGAKILLRAKGE
ncbi:MAG: restriction endonuclease subunit S [Pirellulales bacterium]